MSYDFELSCELPAKPERIYAAWLSSRDHSAMTGGEAEIGDGVGAHYTAWDGYIEGRNLELVPGKRIVQSWRTSEFPNDHPDSRVTIELSAIPAGARLRLIHKGVPDGQTSYETRGWREFYFEPMRAFFSKR